MKKRGGRFLLILGAGLAVMAFVVVYIMTSKAAPDTNAAPAPTAAPELKTVAVINQDVPAYTMLDASNVALMEVEASTAPADATSDLNAITGKLTKVALQKNQHVQVGQLLTSGFSSVLVKGKRAFTLAIPERATFGGSISENDYVDLLWTRNYETIQMIPGADGKPTERTKEMPSTKTLLQDLRVMRFISLRPAPPRSEGQVQGGEGDAEQAVANRTTAAAATAYAADAPVQAVLILEVTDQQAEVIKFAQEQGVIDLTLRSSTPQKGPDGNPLKGPDGKDVIGDHDPEKTTGITDKVLVEQYGLLLPEIIVK